MRGGGGLLIQRGPSKIHRHGGVFKLKAPLLSIILFSQGRGNGGSCQTIEQECAHTHFSFLLLLETVSSGRENGGNLTSRPRPRPYPPPPLTWDKTSICTPTTLATVAWFPSTLYHARAGTLHVPLFESLQLQGCQLLLSKEQEPGLSRRDEHHGFLLMPQPHRTHMT